MQIFSDAILEEQPKPPVTTSSTPPPATSFVVTQTTTAHIDTISTTTSSSSSNIINNNGQPINPIKNTTNVPSKPASTIAPMFSTPEIRATNPTNGSGKNGGGSGSRKRNQKDQVIVLENINLDGLPSSSSSSSASTLKTHYTSQFGVHRPGILAGGKAASRKNNLQKASSSSITPTLSRPTTSSSIIENQFSVDQCLSQHNFECSSTHSDDTSILSPLEINESVMRTLHGIGMVGGGARSSDTWTSWNDSLTSASPRPLENRAATTSFAEDRSPPPLAPPALVTKQETSPLNINIVDTNRSPKPQKISGPVLNPHDIRLHENIVMEVKKPKPSNSKDPESGLTIDTVKRRRLCARYDQLVAAKGVTHRLAEVPNLTNIQVAGLLRRSRNRAEMADISEDVWNFVFEEKRRVEVTESLLDSKNRKSMLLPAPVTNVAEDADELTDCSDAEDFENEFPFEEISNPDEQEEDADAHELLRAESEFYGMRRYFLETDRWLCLLNKSLMDRQALVMKLADQLVRKPRLRFMAPTFAEDDDKSEHCARCMPVRVLDRPKIIEQPAEAFTPDLDIFSLAKDSNELVTLDDKLSKCLEDLSLQLVDEDTKLLVSLEKPPSTLPPLSTTLSDRRPSTILPKPTNAETSAERRIREAQARVKQTAKRLALEQRSVGRPRKSTTNSSSSQSNRDSAGAARRAHLKRKASRDHRDRTNTLSDLLILQENPSERRSFEEQLHRLSSGYVYSEITVPEFRPFHLQTYEERLLTRKVSTDQANLSNGSQNSSNAGSQSAPASLDNSAEQPQQPSTSAGVVDSAINVTENLSDALFFARIHHEIEFPKLSEEEIRRRRKEKWFLPIPKYVPFIAERYEHEDPTKKVLMYCMDNRKAPPFKSDFHPGIHVEPCKHIHREPQIIGTNKSCRHKPPQTPGANQNAFALPTVTATTTTTTTTTSE